MTKQQLLVEIEKIRHKMYSLSNQQTLLSKEIVETSSYLDNLLNKYQRAT